MLNRHYTQGGTLADVLAAVEYETRTCSIRSESGDFIFKVDAEIPKAWSQTAGDILASKYMRKAGLPPDGRGETSIKQVVTRIVSHISQAGLRLGHFTSKHETDIFESELGYILVHQIAAFNSPVWFNCGIGLYGIKGPSGNYAWDWEKPNSEYIQVEDGYARPQNSACFILSPQDSLEGIYTQLADEMRVFRGGGGAGYNASAIRSRFEKLSSGGTSSGLMSFLRVYDTSAGAVKSGGTTRRAARMVCLDMDHPEIFDFITWKSKEEDKARALIAAGYPADFNGEVYQTISGQNANNSVRVTDKFMHAVVQDRTWDLTARTTGEVVRSVRARDLWDAVVNAAWECADPGIHFHDTMNRWNAVPNLGPIRASNPCCFTGEMLVDTSEGLLSFEALEQMSRRGESLPYAYAFDREMNLPVLRPIKKAWVAGTAKKLVEVTTQRGLVLRCTPDHRFLLRNGEYVEAQNLEPGTSLRKIARGVNEKRAGRRYISHRVTVASPRSCVAQARFVWEQMHGPIPDGFDVHHKNEDPTDDRYSNLALIDGVTHGEEHTKGSANPRFIDVDPVALVEVWDAIQGQMDADRKRWSKTFARIKELRQEGRSYAKVAAILDEEGLRPERAEAWSASQVHALVQQGYMGRKGVTVTPTLWNSYIEAQGLKGIVPLANSDIHGMNWQVFTGWIDEQRSQVNDRVASVKFVEGPETVYDIEVEGVHNFGVTMPGAVSPHTIVVSNSEFVFPDNSACNLASLNLMKFIGMEQFDEKSYLHAVSVLIVAMDILVDLSSYPTLPIAKNSHEYRPLGLGYANLGALLMYMGYPYDSHLGRSMAAYVTSMLTAQAYITSAKIAERIGPFAGYAANSEAMLGVIVMHQDAAKEMWGLSKSPQNSLWVKALNLGRQHGYRNSQVSLAAPTGTISLLMDCDTSGIEPDFATVKYKKLAGGGNMKLINNSMKTALEQRGYTEEQVAAMMAYVLGSDAALDEQVVKFEPYERAKIADLLPRAWSLDIPFSEENIPSLYARYSVEGQGVDVLFRALGIDKETFTLQLLGRGTIEGAPGIREEDLPIFDCANRCGRVGVRFIEPMGHVRLMAAIQPFWSMAQSKTVNLPNSATKEDVANIYMESWKMGLKCIALYRDGCKASQPLSTGASEKKDEAKTEPSPAITVPPTPILERRKLPARVGGYRQKVTIGDMDLYLHTGEYDDGSLGEVFCCIGKEGGTLRGLLDAICTLTSIALQYGVPLETLVEKLTHTNYEPAGVVSGDARIKFSSSPLDYLFRHLAVNYLGRDDLAHLPAPPPPSDRGWAPEAATNPQGSRRPPGGVSAPPKATTSGQTCSSCGGLLVRSGFCLTCTACGTSSGCG